MRSAMELQDDEDAAFLSAIAEAERHSLRRRSQDGPPSRPQTESQHAEPAESVSSSSHGPRHGDPLRAFNGADSAAKRPKVEPEGDYMAALRGAHSETWQAMASQAVTASKPSYVPASSLNSKSDAGAARGGATGGCFHCGQEGHWAKDCPTKSNPWGPDSSRPGQSQVQEKNCPCGGGVCKVLTANTEKNPGRQFYKCPLRQEEGQCGFFEWCDGSMGSMGSSQGFAKERFDSNRPAEFPCPCGAGLCITLTAKTEKNMGRQFYRCPLNQGEGSCGFFKWCDENVPAASTPPAYGVSSFKERVPMPNAATGQCYKCGMDGHWARDCPSPGQNFASKTFGNAMRSGPGGDGSMGTCYKCEQVGHWANNCPNQQFSPGRRDLTGGFNRYGGEANFSRGGYSNVRGGFGSSGTGRAVGTASGTCYKCGSKGHWSKDCPGTSQSQGFFSGRLSQK